MTPHGSGCAIQFGTSITAAEPGSVQDLYLIVPSIDAAREKLLARGVQVSEVFHEAALGARFHGATSGRVSGPAPDHATYRSYATFSDPDGNGWLFQEVTARLAGRIDASAAHGEHEQRIGQADPGWPDWYARYMIAEQAGAELPT